MLKVKGLNLHYGKNHVLKDINLESKPNQKIIIVGPNGSGKSTILKSIAGLLPYEGIISFNNEDTRTWPKKKRAKHMAHLTQQSFVYFDFTVYETVMQGRYAHHEKRLFRTKDSKDEEAVENALRKTGLLSLKEKNIRSLSGGQLQRVFLARVFAQEPDIILLDEPTNHLDLKYQMEIMSYLDEWVQEENHLLIGVLHDISLALSFADEIILLKEGEVVSQQQPSKLEYELLNEVFDVDVVTFMNEKFKNWKI